MKKPASEVAHNRPNFFSLMPSDPKSAQISSSFHKDIPLCDFSIMTLLMTNGYNPPPNFTHSCMFPNL